MSDKKSKRKQDQVFKMQTPSKVCVVCRVACEAIIQPGKVRIVRCPKCGSEIA